MVGAMDSQLWAFLLVATLLAVTPGADTLLVVRNVLGRGGRAGLATIGGIAAGCFVHAVLSAVGVSLILVRSAEAFQQVGRRGLSHLPRHPVSPRVVASRRRGAGRAAGGPGSDGRAPAAVLHGGAADQRPEPEGGALLPGVPAPVHPAGRSGVRALPAVRRAARRHRCRVALAAVALGGADPAAGGEPALAGAAGGRERSGADRARGQAGCRAPLRPPSR